MHPRPRGPFGSHLAYALAEIGRHCPTAAERLTALLAPLHVRLDVEAEAVWFCEGHLSAAPDRSADVWLRTDRRTLSDLARGRTDLLEALAQGRLAVTGAVGDLVRAEAAMRMFLRGAVRCASMPSVLSSFENT